MNKILVKKNKKLAINGPGNSLKFVVPKAFTDSTGLGRDDLFDMYYDYDDKIILFEPIEK